MSPESDNWIEEALAREPQLAMVIRYLARKRKAAEEHSERLHAEYDQRIKRLEAERDELAHKLRALSGPARNAARKTAGSAKTLKPVMRYGDDT